MTRSPFVRGAAAIAVATALLPAAEAGAQVGGDGFLFRRPVGSITLRAGVDRALGDGEVFDFVRDQLTFGARGLTGSSLGADVGITLGDRLDLVLGASHNIARSRTRYREFVESDDNEIEQTNSFVRIPVSASLRAYLTPRGRSLGRFAWVPARVAPYVGAGGGAMWYRFKQQGDFVDVETQNLSIFTGTARTSGWAPTAHGLAGLDLSLTPSLALNTEARYNWARATPTGDFADLDRIGLSGLGVTAGITFRF